MTLPIDIGSLLDKRNIESNRVEFKRDWNPAKVLHSICAFANDMDEVGGGYILIGVAENEDGRPDVVGVDPERIPKIEQELFKICNLITPRFIPSFSVEDVEDRKLAVIWVLSDLNRPYRCPVEIGKEREASERVCYIRRMSHTIRATQEEELILLSKRENPSFDSLMNMRASMEDVHVELIREYLSRVNSRMSKEDIPKGELLRMMNLDRGPTELRKPLNVALMMFNPRPMDFFPYARTEVVFKKDPEGSEMTEHYFEGPVDTQIRGSLQLLKEQAVRMKIVKVEGQAEALRFWSYPFGAIEEAVVNAIYHKSYAIGEPVVITVLPDRIEIQNLPGPDYSISDEDIDEHNMISTHYRNKRLGDFLKELGLAEGRNTGIPKIFREMRDNGSGEPSIVTDANRSFMRLTLPIHPRFLKEPSVKTETVGTRDGRADLKGEILDVLQTEGCLSSRELAIRLGYKGIGSNLRRTINTMLEEGVIEYLYPDSPLSPKQRLCLKR